MSIKSVRYDPNWLEIEFTHGSVERFYGQWLRDNIASGHHRNEGQRTFDINMLPPATISGVGHTVDSVSFAPDGTTDVFAETWLRSGCHATGSNGPTIWGSEIQGSLTFADYATLVNEPTSLLGWLTGLTDRGFGLLDAFPTTLESVLDVVGLFGFVRETNYCRLSKPRDGSPRPDRHHRVSSRCGSTNSFRQPARVAWPVGFRERHSAPSGLLRRQGLAAFDEFVVLMDNSGQRNYGENVTIAEHPLLTAISEATGWPSGSRRPCRNRIEDGQGKSTGTKIPDVAHFRELLERLETTA